MAFALFKLRQNYLYYLTNQYDCFVGSGSNLLVIYTLIFCQVFKAQNSFSGRIQWQLGLVSISLEALLLETKGGQKGFHQAVDDVKGTAVVACILNSILTIREQQPY